MIRDEQQQIMAWLKGQSEEDLAQLAQTFTAAMRQWLAAGIRTAVRPQAETSSESQSTRTWDLSIHSLLILYHILSRQTLPNIEAFLRVLAGPTVVRNLEPYLLQGHGSRNQIDRAENLICLSPDAHYYFGSGYIVLEPVGEPLAGIQSSTDVLSSYDVRFSWVTGIGQERA
ncbi:hypothetical protein BGX38DRAFT_1259470 [Terfezia claveryi]|nr:hypothetical protein BGX38DRAFT_1259470 [Terfezia claveryi]